MDINFIKLGLEMSETWSFEVNTTMFNLRISLKQISSEIVQ